MSKQFIFIGCLVLCSLLGCSSAITKEDIFFQASQIKSSEAQNLIMAAPVVSRPSSLPDKERLVYKAKFLGFSIGTFVIMNNGKTMLNGREVYHFELNVRTLPFFSVLFKTKSRYVSYMDAQEFAVVRHEEYIKGGDVLESSVDFNYKEQTATYKNFIDHEQKTVKIPDKILDVLSGGFYLRMLPLALGDTVDLNIYADQKIYNFTGLVSSRAKVDLPHYGKQDAYCFDPYLFFDGEQIKKISAKVFFSATAPAKVLRATLKTLLGNVNVILAGG